MFKAVEGFLPFLPLVLPLSVSFSCILLHVVSLPLVSLSLHLLGLLNTIVNVIIPIPIPIPNPLPLLLAYIFLVVQSKAQHVHGRLTVSQINTQAQPRLGVRRAQPNNRLQASCRNRQGFVILLAPHFGVPVRNVLPGLLRQLRLFSLGVINVFPQEVLRQDVGSVVVDFGFVIVVVAITITIGILVGEACVGVVAVVVCLLPDNLPLVGLLFVVVAVVLHSLERLRLHVGPRLPVPVPPEHVGRDPPVVLRVHLVQHDEEQVEPA